MSSLIASLPPSASVDSTQPPQPPPIKSDIDDPIVQQVIGDINGGSTQNGGGVGVSIPQQPQQQPQQPLQPQQQPQQQPLQQPQQPDYMKYRDISTENNQSLNMSQYDMIKRSVIVACIAFLAFYPSTMDFVRNVIDTEMINNNELLFRFILVAVVYYVFFYLARM